VPSEKQVIKIEYWSEKSLNSVSYWLDGKKLESPLIEIVPLSWGNHEVRVNGIDKNGEKLDDVSWFLKKE
jgi:hypothetical protein